MTDKQKLDEIRQHVDSRIATLRAGGMFQKKGLAELLQIKQLLDTSPQSKQEEEEIKAAMKAPPEGDAPAGPIDLKERSKEIYEKQKAEGKNPEYWEGKDKDPNKKPCPKEIKNRKKKGG